MPDAAYARGMASEGAGWRILRAIDDVPPVPWANGAGTTRELVGYDRSAQLSPAGTAHWRLSIATLERPGPFSPLAGVDRTFLLVGADATLSVDEEVHELRDGDALWFRGDQDVVLVALSAACHAVNLMTTRTEGATAPRLHAGLAESATLAVALEDSGDVARFDLLERATGDEPAIALPAEVASLVLE